MVENVWVYVCARASRMYDTHIDAVRNETMREQSGEEWKKTTEFLFVDFITHSYGQWKLMATDNNDASILTYGLRLFPYTTSPIFPFPEDTIIKFI